MATKLLNWGVIQGVLLLLTKQTVSLTLRHRIMLAFQTTLPQDVSAFFRHFSLF